jgi:hypothetical protein
VGARLDERFGAEKSTDVRKLLASVTSAVEEAAKIPALEIIIRGRAGGRFERIPVVARTLNGGKEVSGYEVWYAPMGLKDFRELYRRFPSLSSPTEALVSPGRYLFWVAKDGKLSTPLSVDVH